MLYMLFHRDVEEDEAAKLFNKPILEFPDSVFDYEARNSDDNVSMNTYFQEIIKEIDRADVPMKNVIRDIPTGDTRDIYKTSTGAKTLWLAYKGMNYTFLSEWFGPNCYQRLFDISKDVDIYMYDDSDMFNYEKAEKIIGEFTDFKTGELIKVDYDNAYEYLESRGYY